MLNNFLRSFFFIDIKIAVKVQFQKPFFTLYLLKLKFELKKLRK